MPLSSVAALTPYHVRVAGTHETRTERGSRKSLLFWRDSSARAVSSAEEQPAYNRQVTGSSPVPPTEEISVVSPLTCRQHCVLPDVGWQHVEQPGDCGRLEVLSARRAHAGWPARRHVHIGTCVKLACTKIT